MYTLWHDGPSGTAWIRGYSFLPAQAGQKFRRMGVGSDMAGTRDDTGFVGFTTCVYATGVDCCGFRFAPEACLDRGQEETPAVGPNVTTDPHRETKTLGCSYDMVKSKCHKKG